MKLSEAILLGSLDNAQGFGPGSIMQKAAEKCALGAALHAVNYQGDFYYGEIGRRWPWTNQSMDRCPCGIEHYYGIPNTIFSIIWILNDVHRWTRPQIAEWVATKEPKDSIYQPVLDVIDQCEANRLNKNS